MSYYTYFYPKKEQYNPCELSAEEIKNKIIEAKEDFQSKKIRLIVALIQHYYTKEPSLISCLETIWKTLVYECDRIAKYEWMEVIKEDMEAYGEVAINHASCPSKYYLEEAIERNNAVITNCFTRILVIASAQPFYNKKEKNSYNEEELDYLTDAFLELIESIIEEVIDTVEDRNKNYFMLDYYDTKVEENGLKESKLE